MKMWRTPPSRTIRKSRASCPDRQAVRLEPSFAFSIARTRSHDVKCVNLCFLARRDNRGFIGRLMPLRERGAKKVGCSYESPITFYNNLPKGWAWTTLCLNNCRTGHPRCITKIMLPALPAARRVSLEEDNMEATVSQIHQSGAAPRVCVDMW